VNAQLYVKTLVTVLVILDPIGSVPVFLALTADKPAQRRRAARQATLVAGTVILVFALFGQAILSVLDISMASLQISGGMLLALVSLELLGPTGLAASPSPVAKANPALVPLGTPLLAGPGAIAATMVFWRESSSSGIGAELIVVAGLTTAIAGVYLSLRLASPMARLLRANGVELVTRIVGLLLAAISVQLIADGALQLAG
jgi:multiple antibiotic resistance protein